MSGADNRRLGSTLQVPEIRMENSELAVVGYGVVAPKQMAGQLAICLRSVDGLALETSSCRGLALRARVGVILGGLYRAYIVT